MDRFYTVKWTRGESKGYTDELPVAWFKKEGVIKEATHNMRGPRGSVAPAECSVEVHGKFATLNYVIFEKFNKHNGVLIGLLKIEFSSAKRTKIQTIYWRDKGKEFVDWTKDTECGSTSVEKSNEFNHSVSSAIKLSDKDGDRQKITSNSGKGHAGPAKLNKSTPVTVEKRMLKLRKYFNEYSGEGRTKGHEGGKRTVAHGDIVTALEALLGKTGESQKAQAIDLAVVSPQHIALFEVKTSARTTDVYTGVGQLLIHGECVSELTGLPVRRYLVLPDRPSKAHEPHIVRKGGIRIVTFQKVKGNYTFTGI